MLSVSVSDIGAFVWQSRAIMVCSIVCAVSVLSCNGNHKALE